MTQRTSKIIAQWHEVSVEYRVVVNRLSGYRNPDFIIESTYKDSMGEKSWKVVRHVDSNEEILLALFKGLESGQYELVKRY